MRSLLFVPGDSPKKLDKGFACGVDCLLIDLEDSVAAGAKSLARQTAANFLACAHSSETRPLLFEMGARLGLVRTGSSDYHGLGKKRSPIGANLTRPSAYRDLVARIRRRGGVV